MDVDPRVRFSGRAAYYDTYRPQYPAALLNFLRGLGFSRNSVVADIGSGTGILTKLLLKNGNTVFAVEPNEDMRRAAEAGLSHYPAFRSVDGSAESTGLRTRCVDFVTAAQSFHWFKQSAARREFQRILRVNGWVVLLWNTRKTSTPFLQAYDQLVIWVTAKTKGRVRQEDLTADAVAKFLGKRCQSVKLENSQELDFDGLVGRLTSASYSPLPGDALRQDLIQRAREVLNQFQKGGLVKLEYWTEVHAGQLGEV